MLSSTPAVFVILRPKQNGHHCTDSNFKGLSDKAVSNGFKNDLVPFGDKPLVEIMLTQINNGIWHH